jgi:hypothetical protein
MPLKGREELGVYESRLRVFEFLSHVSCQPEVWILKCGSIKPFAKGEQPYLVDCARNKTWDVGLFAEHVWKGI